MTAPLFRGEDIVGLLVVRRRTPGAFPQNTVDVIKTFAAQSVLAIQNARLFEDVEARTSELAKSLKDLQAAQDRLVQTEKLASLGQLTAGIAHEIKNPLNFVNNFSSVSVELIDELREVLDGVSLPWFDAALFVRPRTRSWLGDAPTVVFVDQPLNGEKSPTKGKDLQFCRPN